MLRNYCANTFNSFEYKVHDAEHDLFSPLLDVKRIWLVNLSESSFVYLCINYNFKLWFFKCSSIVLRIFVHWMYFVYSYVDALITGVCKRSLFLISSKLHSEDMWNFWPICFSNLLLIKISQEGYIKTLSVSDNHCSKINALVAKNEQSKKSRLIVYFPWNQTKITKYKNLLTLMILFCAVYYDSW